MDVENIIEAFKGIKDQYLGNDYYRSLFMARRRFFPADMSVAKYCALSGLAYIQSCAIIEGYMVSDDTILEAYKKLVLNGTSTEFYAHRAGCTEAYNLEIKETLGDLGK